MAEEKKIRVFIADDFDILRQVIQLVLERTEDIETVGEAPHLRDALEKVKKLQPDVILMNDYIPPTDSARAAKLFRELDITAAILIISMHAEPHLIQRSLTNGANGFMHKDEMGTLLMEAVRKVHNKEQYLSPKAEDALMYDDD